MELVGGMRDACAEYALALVGGDTNRADLVVVSVAVVGEVAPGRAVLRSGARVGDRIVVTGSLGAAAGGLALSRAAAGRAAEALSQTFAVQKGMSALPPKADMCGATRDVRFVPIADMCDATVHVCSGRMRFISIRCCLHSLALAQST